MHAAKDTQVKEIMHPP